MAPASHNWSVCSSSQTEVSYSCPVCLLLKVSSIDRGNCNAQQDTTSICCSSAVFWLIWHYPNGTVSLAACQSHSWYSRTDVAAVVNALYLAINLGMNASYFQNCFAQTALQSQQLSQLLLASSHHCWVARSLLRMYVWCQGAIHRGDWYRTKDLIAQGSDWIIKQVKMSKIWEWLSNALSCWCYRQISRTACMYSC